MKEEELDNIFTYHKPFNNQADRYEAIRKEARQFAVFINSACPDSREKSLAITKLQECVMFANAAIALHEKESL